MSENTSSRVEEIVGGVAQALKHLRPAEIVAHVPTGPPGILFVFLFAITHADPGAVEDLEDRIGEALSDADTRVSLWIASEAEWRRLREHPAHTARHVYLHGTSFGPMQWDRRSGAA
ncbi:MAG: hypothetical protein H0X65_16265 [Gemmatimonadetes bacterium]|nr:hypothetical protein [Gemmatimonadota bacterium]